MGEIFSGGGGSFVDSAMKAELAKLKVPFAIVGCTVKSENSFGADVCTFELRISAKAAKAAKSPELEGEWTLELTHNPVRERQAKALASYLVSEPHYGPAYIDQVTAKNGKLVWVIADEPGDGSVKATEYDDPDAEAEDAADEDDIPF